VIEQLRGAEGNAAELTRIWNSVPAEDREAPGFLVRAVPYLVGAGDECLALEAIEKALEREWDSELAVLYGRCKSADLRSQLASAEKWLKDHPHDSGLLLTLGRLCVRGQLWGKAQSYFEASLSLAPSRMAHVELARLMDSLERPAEAQRHYREAAVLGA
jgi:HemY protein